MQLKKFLMHMRNKIWVIISFAILLSSSCRTNEDIPTNFYTIDLYLSNYEEVSFLYFEKVSRIVYPRGYILIIEKDEITIQFPKDAFQCIIQGKRKKSGDSYKCFYYMYIIGPQGYKDEIITNLSKKDVTRFFSPENADYSQKQYKNIKIDLSKGLNNLDFFKSIEFL